MELKFHLELIFFQKMEVNFSNGSKIPAELEVIPRSAKEF